MGKNNEKREIDLITKDVYGWSSKAFAYAKKTNVRSWKALVTIAFVAGSITAILMLVSLNVQNLGGAATNKVSFWFAFDQQDQEVAVNETFNTDITLNTNGRNVYVARAIIKYDPAYFAYAGVSTTDSIFKTGGSDNKTCTYNGGPCQVIDASATGTVSITMAKPVPVNTTSGVLATLSLTALKATPNTGNEITDNTPITIEFNPGAGGSENYLDSDIIVDNADPALIKDGLEEVTNAKIIIQGPADGACGTNAAVYPAVSTGTGEYEGTFCELGEVDPDLPAFPKPGDTVDWTCSGVYGGADVICSASRSAEVINGTCGTANGREFSFSEIGWGNYTQCATGNVSSTAFPIPGSSVNWDCGGLNGGTTANCSASRANEVINGVCGTNAQSYPAACISQGETVCIYTGTFCSAGTASPASPAFPVAGGSTAWTCQGSNEGTNANCTATRGSEVINGSCGTRNTTYSSSISDWPSNSTYCATGTASVSPNFPATGASVTWICLGGLGGTNSGTCTASRTAAPINGVCGTANGRKFEPTETSWGNYTQCSSGTPSYTGFPSVGGSVYWTCSGINGGTNSSSCSASRGMVTCSSFTYGPWTPATCPQSQQQTRTVTPNQPGCTGGNPESATQSCVYTAPACTGYDYSGWSKCKNSKKTRTIDFTIPSSCSGGVAPVLQAKCSSSSKKKDKKKPKFDPMPSFLTKWRGAKIWWHAKDNKKVTKYTYKFNGKTVKTKKTSFNVPLDTRPGLYTLKLKAYDKAGNSATKYVVIRVR